MAGGRAEAGLSADFFGRCVVEFRSDVEPEEPDEPEEPEEPEPEE